jgi:hypothetical protein
MQQPCHNATIVEKGYEGLDWWNFAHVNKQPWRRIFFIKNFNFFQVVKFILYVFKTIFTTLCYNNDEDCDILKL